MVDMKTNELLNCPFCGYEVDVLRKKGYLKIYCLNLTLTCPIKDTEWYSDEDLAINVWNNRKPLERNNLG